MRGGAAYLAIGQPLQTWSDGQQQRDGQRVRGIVVAVCIGLLALLFAELLAESFDGVGQLTVIRSTVHADHAPKCFRLGWCQLRVEVRQVVILQIRDDMADATFVVVPMSELVEVFLMKISGRAL